MERRSTRVRKKKVFDHEESKLEDRFSEEDEIPTKKTRSTRSAAKKTTKTTKEQTESTKTRKQNNKKISEVSELSKEEDDSNVKRNSKKKCKSNEFKENKDKQIDTSNVSTKSSSTTKSQSTTTNQSNDEQDDNTAQSSESGNGFDIVIMRRIFAAAQYIQKENKCVQSMFKLIKEVKFEEFYKEFCRNVKCTIQYDYDNPKVKNILDMIATFTISIKNENILKNKLNEDTFDEIGLELFGKDTFFIATISKTYKNLLDYILNDALIPFLNSTNFSTRLNTLYLIRKILLHCVDIEITIFNRLKKALLLRIRDRNPNVRHSTVHTLQRFQTVDDPNDMVIGAFIFHLNNDPIISVRLACLHNVYPAHFVLSHIIMKTRDSSSKIRQAAFKKISKHDFKQLTTDQRLTLLNNGFKDRNEKIRETVRTFLVPAWIKSYDDDMINLLTDLDVISNAEVISRFLEIVFQYSFSVKIEKRTRLHLIIEKFYDEHLDERSILNKKQLLPENCLFWRCLGAFLKQNEDEIMKCQPDLENKMNLRKEINSLIEAVGEQLEVNETNIPSMNDSTEQNNNEQDSHNDVLLNRLEPEEQSMINELEDDSLSKANPIDLIIPSLSNYIAFFKSFCHEINKEMNGQYQEEDRINFEFVFKELCLFLNNYEIGDHSQKQLIINLVEEILMMDELGDKFDEYIEHLMKFLSKSTFTTNEELINYTVLITNKIEESLEHNEPEELLPVIDAKEIRKKEMQQAKIVTDKKELEDKIEEAAVKGEKEVHERLMQDKELIEEELAEIKHEIAKMKNISIRQHSEPEIEIDIKDHPSVHLKLLQIFGSFLRYGQFKNLNAMMDTRIKKYIIPGILSTDSKIRYYALKALNHACFLSSTLSAQFFALYHEICTKDNENLQITALQGLIDSLIEHGLHILYQDNPPEPEPQSILNTPAPFEIDEDQNEERKKSNANSMFTNTREFTKESSFLLNKSEITTPNISMTEDDDENEANKLHHNTNNESDLDGEENENDEFDKTQANLTMKSQILGANRTANKSQLQIEREEEIIKELTKFLLKFIRSNNEEIKSTSVMAICKLLLLGKIYSPLLLSELILLWYNSSTSLNIQHDIGTFLPIYCQASALYHIEIPENFNGQHCLFECFMSTVENVYRLERGEQLNLSFEVEHSNYYDRDIDVLNVIQFMLNLLEPINHAKMAIEFCERILEILKIDREDEYQFRESYATKYLIRSLDSFNLLEATDDEKNRLRAIVEAIQSEDRYKELKNQSISKIEKLALFLRVPSSDE